ncbi:MAG: sugar phosphate isomerase/epimerase [Spirochaetia bacterium]|jgi:sugar phosphate isomerase/epimerase|nr:sugar phosphate isomerase/epimerase [Spirochaetia bacterium]
MGIPDLRLGVKFPASFTQIQELKDIGYEFLELNTDTFPFIIEGSLCEPVVNCIKQRMKSTGIHLTIHSSYGMDLWAEDSELQEKVLASCIRLASLLQASVVVLHYECQSNDLRKRKKVEDLCRKGADLAQEAGILLCLENIEIELVEPVIELVAKINHPNFKMTFDTGHAFLASRFLHFDFLQSLKDARPYLGHVHINDNTGTFQQLRIENKLLYDTLSIGTRRAFGQGDIHLPPYFGKVPLDECFKILKGYTGRMLLEYKFGTFNDLDSFIYNNTKDRIRSIWQK